jgi:hypothetical protein
MRYPIKMASKHFPHDRRDLQQHMVDEAVANFFVVCVLLKLCSMSSVPRVSLLEFSQDLFRMVKRKHTHLWSKDASGQYHANQWRGSNEAAVEVVD